MLSFFTDPLVTAVISGLACGVGGFLLAKYSRKAGTKLLKSSTPPEDEQAVTEFEVIEALSAIGVAGDTLRAVKDNIKTVAQLKRAVSQLEWNNLTLLTEKFYPLAMQYSMSVVPNSPVEYSLLAKAIVIAQCSLGNSTIHPAFSSIAERMQALSPPLWKNLRVAMEEAVRKLAPGKTMGVWIDRKLADQFAARSRSSYGYYDPEKSCTYGPRASDFLAPGEGGNIRIKRVTFYNDLGSSTSDWIALNRLVTADEREFWMAMAKARIAWMMDTSKGDGGSNILGTLLEWSEFLRALESKNTSITAVQNPVAERTLNDDAPDEDVLLEQLVSTKIH